MRPLAPILFSLVLFLTGTDRVWADDTIPAAAPMKDGVPLPAAAMGDGDAETEYPDGIPEAMGLPATSELIPATLALSGEPIGEFEDDLFIEDGFDAIVFDDAVAGPEPSFILSSGVTIDVGFESLFAYDDNIFLSDDKEGDVVFRFRPNLAIAFGDGRAKQESYIEVVFEPTANVFFDNDEENSIDQDLNGAVQWKKSKITVLGEAGYQKLSEASSEVGDRFDRDVYEAALELAYAVTEKVGVALRGDYEGYRYEEGTDFEDSDDIRGEIRFGYIISPKAQLAVGYGYGELDFDQSGKQTYHQAFLDAEWAPREKIALEMRVGAEHRDLITEKQTIPMLEGGVRYLPREKTLIALRAYNREESSPFTGGESYTATGVEFEVQQGIGKRFTGIFEAGYEHADYNGGLDPDLNDRSDDIWFVRPALEYQLREWLSLEAFYLYRKNDSEGGGFSYTNNQAGVAAKVIF